MLKDYLKEVIQIAAENSNSNEISLVDILKAFELSNKN